MDDDDFYDDEPYEPDEQDMIAEAELNCGKLSDGVCMLAGTEYCDWGCPFSW